MRLLGTSWRWLTKSVVERQTSERTARAAWQSRVQQTDVQQYNLCTAKLRKSVRLNFVYRRPRRGGREMNQLSSPSIRNRSSYVYQATHFLLFVRLSCDRNQMHEVGQWCTKTDLTQSSSYLSHYTLKRLTRRLRSRRLWSPVWENLRVFCFMHPTP